MSEVAHPGLKLDGVWDAIADGGLTIGGPLVKGWEDFMRVEWVTCVGVSFLLWQIDFFSFYSLVIMWMD